MNFTHIFASAVIRKLAYLLVALVFGWLSMGRANAQAVEYSQCYDTSITGGDSPYWPVCPNRQVAYEQVKIACEVYSAPSGGPCGLYAPSVVGPNPGVRARNIATNGYSTYRGWAVECPSGQTWDEATHTCKGPKVCDPAAPELTSGFMKYTGTEPGYQTCVDGCTFNPSSMTYKTGRVDGINYVSLAGWIPSGATCTVGPNDEYQPPVDTDKDGTSDGNDAGPNNPGKDGQGTDGPPANKDTDGNNSSGGGGDCSSPPNSSGDAIGAQIAFQAWATRCAVESLKDANGNVKTTVGPGGTSTGTGGTGGGGGVPSDPNTSILTAIKTAVEKVKDFVTGAQDEVDTLDDTKGEDVLAADAWSQEDGAAQLDASGFGWGNSCPSPPQISIPGGGSLDWSLLCTAAGLFGALILAAGYVQAAYIIGRA